MEAVGFLIRIGCAMTADAIPRTVRGYVLRVERRDIGRGKVEPKMSDTVALFPMIVFADRMVELGTAKLWSKRYAL